MNSNAQILFASPKMLIWAPNFELQVLSQIPDFGNQGKSSPIIYAKSANKKFKLFNLLLKRLRRFSPTQTLNPELVTS